MTCTDSVVPPPLQKSKSAPRPGLCGQKQALTLERINAIDTVVYVVGQLLQSSSDTNLQFFKN